MAIDCELQIKAYELLIDDLQKRYDELHKDLEAEADESVERTTWFCDFIFRELGYDKLMELAKIIDDGEKNSGDMPSYVETFYSGRRSNHGVN